MGQGAVIFVFTIFISLPVPGECCEGRAVLTDSSGIITDGDEKYPSYARCEWLIDAKVPNKTIYLEFDELNTECSYDFLFIYDGNSYRDQMLASFSGNNIPDPVMAQSGQMLVYLFSDRNYERKGFRARYSIQDCPMNCSGQGNCIDHRCHCYPGRFGTWCQFTDCPNECSGNGHCVTSNETSTAYCQCDKGYSGYMCNISLNDSEGSEYWYELAPNGVGLEARSAHAGALLSLTNCLYIFGGFSLNEIMNDLKRFCMDTNKWESIIESQPWPESRYEHAIVEFGHGFYMFGGILENGTYCNELWYFNATVEVWNLCALNSSIRPLQLSGHTLTLVENDLYLFGGKTNDGQFWANIYKINGHSPDQWEEVIPLGGKSSLRRRVGHSTVYHKESKSLLIYGGYSHSRDQPRFGSHTNNLHVFHVENRIWSQLRFSDAEMSKVPSQRSFHSAVIMGNYMVIYGGNTHIHHDLELCYDFEMYLYHLGCHTWVSITHLLGKYAEAGKTMQRQGRVSHVAAKAYGNILLVAGGYSGYVRGDLIAFKFPPIVAPPSSEIPLDLDYCTNYTRPEKCMYNPDCLHCNNVSTTNTMGCLHRTRKQLCRNSDTQHPVVACPGICGRLSTCLECLSQGQGATLEETSLEQRTYIQPCNWCVKEAQCQQRSKPEGNCVNEHNTVTGIVGWWGGTSASLSQIDQCRLEDFPAGLHTMKYRPMVDIKHPDEVTVIRETEENEQFRHIYVNKNKNYLDIISWMGFIHPLNATIKIIQDTVIYGLKLVSENISVRMLLSKDADSSKKELVQTLTEKETADKTSEKEFNYREDGTLLFPNISRGNKYYVEIIGNHKYPNYLGDMTLGSQMYNFKLKWNGLGTQGKPEIKNYHPFHYEFLEPYSNGDCSKHDNCLACMTDTLCGWCGPAQLCLPRSTNIDVCVGENKTEIMITEPSMCPTCADYVECSSCAGDPRCEWVKEYVYCLRRGRADSSEHGVRRESECPLSCHERKTCSACLNISECAWCENLHTCLPFSDYVSRHRHGQCTEWIDSEVANSNNPYTCRNCTSLKTCDMCLQTFSCGWCGNEINPTIGVCYEGDFNGPYLDGSCSSLISSVYKNTSVHQQAHWSYSMCPDVKECLLGMAMCHPNATCINTPTSYDCKCNQGFTGNGRDTCTKTCYYKCVHGECLEDDNSEFSCDCNIGWTGNDCGTDCKCNGHSMCDNGTGKCDYCINGTTGKFCGQCLTGHYGDPSKPEGCLPCRCNKHGNKSKGLCHNMTGDCFCVDNTEGLECDSCQKGYYGDPRDGGKCYLNCDHGQIIENITEGSVGSYSGPGVATWKAYCLWILTVSSNINDPWSLPPSITFSLEDMAVQCERDHVYVYDGIPESIDSTGSGVLLGAFCGFYSGEFRKVVAMSGIITIYFAADISGVYTQTRGFNGSYYVNRCPEDCNEMKNQYCNHSTCVCMEGYVDFPECSREVCLEGCTYQQGTDSCLCVSDFGASPYNITMYPWDANAIPADFHGNGPSSRYGHALIYCDKDLYLFGGRSLERGLLNDMWQYNFSINQWTEIKPDIGNKPSPRYFHAGECMPSLKILYIFGGLEVIGGSRQYIASKEMWKFNIGQRSWSGPSQPDWIHPLAGHTMTRGEGYKLIIIGGFSRINYFNDIVYIYDTNGNYIRWKSQEVENRTMAQPAGIYGHSAVYNEDYKTIYIFGGHVFKDERIQLSHYLFTYDVTDGSWNLLRPKSFKSSLQSSMVEARYFHTAVGFEDYMVVIGGLTQYRNTSSDILVYKYKCNYWLKLDLSGTAAGVAITSLIAARSVRYRDSVYIQGGFSGIDHSALYRIKFPLDICSVHCTLEACLQPGCSALIENKPNSASGNVTVCYKSGTRISSRSGSVKIEGPSCDVDCENITSCSECVAMYPPFKDTYPTCYWSDNRCVLKGNNETSLEAKLRCIKPCEASTCEKCVDKGCIWSEFFTQESSANGVRIRNIGLGNKYNWNCVQEIVFGTIKDDVPKRECKDQVPCYKYQTCRECLGSPGVEGGSRECYWSESLKECMTPAYLSLHCVGGTCGTLLQGPVSKCPATCQNNTKCADCRQAQGCGWCANGGQNGKGVCLPGTRSGPAEKEMCEQKSIAFPEKITDVDILTWAYARCPPEDECLNGHHNCDLETENCNDELNGFSCTCKKGYIKKEEKGKLLCSPICHHRCVNGKCVRPENCVCDFGYIGKNCSTKCECNEHSNCESVDQKDMCLECMNNTQGDHCEKCKPLYVGDPRNGGRCVSCTDFCHSHSDICVLSYHLLQREKEINALLHKYPNTKSDIFLEKFKLIQPVGPSQQNNTKCHNCSDNTEGNRCEKCDPGYFRLHDMLPNEPCTKCMCNGHSDDCDSDSGLNCRCENNTETKCNNNDNNKIVKCHESQCASCKDYFLGTPTNGHHCYRQMTVNIDYCLDPFTQAECTRIPTPLQLGKTVFFAVQPKYVNVDIRVTVDITQGGIDVYFSPHDDTFQVHVNTKTLNHQVQLDPNTTSHVMRRRRRDGDAYKVQLDPMSGIHNVNLNYHNINSRLRYQRSSNNKVIYAGFPIKEMKATDINTFITVNDPDTVLIIRNLKGRLVITLPNDKLNLKTSRFYMVFLSTGDTLKNETKGNLYFRQDQPHIDLFVFFSVFFSCFFLFLAMCVLLWKTKQGFDARRTRQQRAREMLHMASRPFAKVLVLIDHAVTPINISPNLRNRPRKTTDRTPLLPSETGVPTSPIVVRDNLNIVPIAIEPTDDGVAAIGTIVFRLPGGVNAPSQVCLGSTLTNQLTHSWTVGKLRRPPASSNC